MIEEAIVSGELAPGTVLRQEQLSEQFNVSRTPVREALRRLAALGLVSFVPNRGVRVRTISREELHEAFMVRAELEGLATEVAATKITPEELEELDDVREALLRDLAGAARARARATSGARSWATGCARTTRFHDVIYRVAALPLVEQLAKSARRTFSGPAVWAPGDHSLDGLYVKNAEQHRAIKQALAGRQRRRRARARARARALVVRPAGDDPRAGRRAAARLAEEPRLAELGTDMPRGQTPGRVPISRFGSGSRRSRTGRSR